ncbi:MAG: antitoxin family protein [Kiritimatiellae bacterium]|nr:antitoxin family protein [Kiritimatiellia bacterium]
MLKTYEATYEHGRLKWLHGRPSIPDGSRVLVVVETAEPAERAYALRGTPVTYKNPTEPVAASDWDAVDDSERITNHESR